MNIAYNADCLPAMREMPDNAFDLAVVDPPYGDALANESGGVLEQVRSTVRPVQIEHLHSSRRRAERERSADDTDRAGTSDNRTERGVMRTGGTWATKYAKKSSRGT